jgi:hypothetical protein
VTILTRAILAIEDMQPSRKKLVDKTPGPQNKEHSAIPTNIRF